MKKKINILSLLLILVLIFTGCSSEVDDTNLSTQKIEQIVDKNNENFINGIEIPEYNGKAYVEINNGIPLITKSDLTTDVFENYSDLDDLDRCGVAYANICKEIMPTEKRGSIGMVKPSGWHTVKYDCVDGKYLYNRCHLIGFQLAGENANEKNLITGTRYLNIEGMLPFENMIDDYVEETNNHVLYRVTPHFKGDNLVASGVLMEARSVEDNDLSFCVYAYNVQPGVTINYATGESFLDGEEIKDETSEESTITMGNELYILNINSDKFHKPDCSSVDKMSEGHKEETKESRESLINRGYQPCKSCNP